MNFKGNGPLKGQNDAVGSAEIGSDIWMVLSPPVPGINAFTQHVQMLLVRHGIPSFRGELHWDELWMFWEHPQQRLGTFPYEGQSPPCDVPPHKVRRLLHRCQCGPRPGQGWFA